MNEAALRGLEYLRPNRKTFVGVEKPYSRSRRRKTPGDKPSERALKLSKSKRWTRKAKEVKLTRES